MKNRYSNRLKNSAAPLAVGLALVSSPVVAQNNEEDITSEQREIIVTGSRIVNSRLNNSEPTIKISNEYYEDRNLTNAADALNELPQFRSSVTPNGTQGSFGNGVNFVNTYGLGSNRTLTLVNGRRVVSSNVPSLFGSGAPGTQVDLNIIPTILIDRVDAVSVGGAPVYGSDAIAGTVNIILRDQYDGLTINAQSGITSRGDSFNYNVSALGGQYFAGEKGNVTLALSYDNVEGLRGVDRDFNREEIGFLRNCTSGTAIPDDGRLNPNIGCNLGPDDGVPAEILYRNVVSPFLSPTGVILELFNFRQFGPDGSLVDVATVNNLDGFFGTTGSATPNTYRTANQTQITSDLERVSANLFLSYEVSPGIELFSESLYFKSTARESGSNPVFNTFVFDPDASGGLDFDIATNPFLSQAVKDELTGEGLTQFNLSRSNEDLIDQSAFSKSELKRGVVGVRGDFNAFGRPMNFEAAFNYGETEIVNISQQINQQNFINAVTFTTDINGNAVCTLTPAVPVAPGQPVQPIADANCVPLNLFGFRVATPEALDYISENTREVANLRQMVFSANVGGTMFDTWAGPIGFNVGYEHRDEKAGFEPSTFAQQGRGRGAPIAPTAGRYNLDEVFGEVLIPLASPNNDIPLISSAEVFGRVRYVDNTVNGQFTAFTVGGRIDPISDISFRGNFTRSFRAPAITELFLPQSPTFERPTDACRDSNIATGPDPETRIRNCTAFLQATGNDPASYVLLAESASVSGLSGGNPNLRNEKADSWTVGVVVQPRFAPGLIVTADYVNINITDPISQLESSDLVTGCFDNQNFDLSDPINGNQFCSQLGFNASGQIPNDQVNPAVRTGFVNGQSYQFEAVTGAVDFTTSLDSMSIDGSLNLGVDGLYLIRRFNNPIGVGAQANDGLVDDPRFSAQGRVRYNGANWGFGAYVNFTGIQLVSVNNRGESPNDVREFDHFDPYATVDANIYIKTDDKFRINLSVTNAFDRIGQEYYGSYIPASINDEIGRRFRVSVTKEF